MAQSAKDRRYAPMNSMIPGDVNFNPAEHMDLTDFGSSDTVVSENLYAYLNNSFRTVLAHKLKTPVTHRTRSRLAAAMRAIAATTARHGHIGTFEWRGPSRNVRVRLLGRLKRVKRAGVSRSKLNVRYCS